MRQRPQIRGGVPKESMEVTITVPHYIGDIEPEEATSCSQAGTPAEPEGHQLTNKTFDPKFILFTRNAEVGDGGWSRD